MPRNLCMSMCMTSSNDVLGCLVRTLLALWYERQEDVFVI